MKIVIISDIHANYEALSALSECGDELWVLGDLVNYGPDPGAVIEFVRSRASVVVRGNHDHSIGYGADPRCSPRFRAMAEATRRWTDSVLNPADKQFLRDLPLTEIVRRGTEVFQLCHALPSDPLYAYCPKDSGRWPGELATLSADTLLVGHTHTPFLLELNRQRVANPGSLGQPKTGSPEANYAVWEDGAFRLCSFSYDVEQTIAKIERMPIAAEIKEELSEVLRTGAAARTPAEADHAKFN